MESEKKSSYLIRDVPPDLWDRVKHTAISKGMTIKDYIISVLEKETKSWREK
jgi:predicted DNA binding CopG/RHH family protein